MGEIDELHAKLLEVCPAEHEAPYYEKAAAARVPRFALRDPGPIHIVVLFPRGSTSQAPRPPDGGLKEKSPAVQLPRLDR